MSECPECERLTGVFVFSRQCCRVRYLLGEPRRNCRVSMVELWTKTYGKRAMAGTVEEVTARWKAK